MGEVLWFLPQTGKTVNPSLNIHLNVIKLNVHVIKMFPVCLILTTEQHPHKLYFLPQKYVKLFLVGQKKP